jgi:hypothetical protein
MLYHIQSYDPKTGLAFGVLASEYNARTTYSSGMMDSLYSKQELQINNTYSFKPKHRFIGGILTIAEIDQNDDQRY